MPRVRVSISGIMTIVALLAANLVLVRALVSGDPRGIVATAGSFVPLNLLALVAWAARRGRPGAWFCLGSAIAVGCAWASWLAGAFFATQTLVNLVGRVGERWITPIVEPIVSVVLGADEPGPVVDVARFAIEFLVLEAALTLPLLGLAAVGGLILSRARVWATGGGRMARPATT